MPRVFSDVLTDGVASGGAAVAPEVKLRLLPRPNRKTVLFVTNTGEYGGAEKHLVELIRRLCRSGNKISVLCIDADLYTERLSADELANINIRRNQRIKGWGLKLFWEWFREFRHIRPDVVVFVRAWLWCYPWYVPLAAWLAGIARRFSIGHLVPPPILPTTESNVLHSHIVRVRRAGHLLALKLSVAFQDGIICVSNAIRDPLIREFKFPEHKVMTIHNGVSLSHYDPSENNRLPLRARLGIGPDEVLLVCPARLNEQKRIDLLLLAMAKVVGDGLRCKCVIVGDGPLKKVLTDQMLALDLSRSVMFEGFQNDVRPYLWAADAFVLTSDVEGLPLSILEAMASSLACVVTNVGGNAEAVVHEVTGLVVPSGSVDAIAGAIAYLVTHPRERAEMSKAARARAVETFNIDQTMASIERVLLD